MLNNYQIQLLEHKKEGFQDADMLSNSLLSADIRCTAVFGSRKKNVQLLLAPKDFLQSEQSSLDNDQITGSLMNRGSRAQTSGYNKFDEDNQMTTQKPYDHVKAPSKEIKWQRFLGPLAFRKPYIREFLRPSQIGPKTVVVAEN